MSSINSEEIISILKEEIDNFQSTEGVKEVGNVIWVGDGIATVYGIDYAMYGEFVTFEMVLKEWYRISKEMKSASLFSEKIQELMKVQRLHVQRKEQVFP